MTYLLSQLWFCLLLAWMLGNIVGWLLRGGCSEHIKRVEKNWRERYLELEKEKESYRVKLEKYKGVGQEKNNLSEQLQRYQGIEAANAKLKMRVKQIENKAVALHGEAKSRGQSLLGLQDRVSASKKIILSKDGDLKNLADKLKVSVNQINSFKSQYQEVKGKYENKISQQEALIQDLKQQLDTEKVQVEKVSKDTLIKHQEAKDKYETKISEQGTLIQSLKQQLDTANVQVENISKESSTKSQEEKNSLSQKLDDTTKELENYKQLLEKSDASNTKIYTKMADGEARMKMLAAEFSKMAAKLIEAESEVKRVKSLAREEQDTPEFKQALQEVKTYKARLEEKEQESASLQARLKEEGVKNNALEETLKQVPASADRKHKNSEVDEKTLKDITSKLEKEQAKNSKQKEKINKLSTKLEKSRSKLVDVHKRLQEKEGSPTAAGIQSFVSSELVDENKPAKNSQEYLVTELKQSKQKIKSLEAESLKNNKLLHRLEQKVQEISSVGSEVSHIAADMNVDSHQLDSTKRNPSKGMNLLERSDRENADWESESDQKDIIPVNCEIEEIRGIGPGYGMRLRKLGISTNQDLLKRISSNKDIKSIAKKLSRKPAEILSWRKMADFLTIEGVSSEFAKLLELSNVSSAEELAQSNTTALAEKMAVAKKKERRIHNTPDTEEIGEWINNAKKMNTK